MTPRRTVPTPASPSSGTTARRTSARRPNRCTRPPPGTASAGCRMTGRDTADRPLTRAGTWHRRPPTCPASPMRWAWGSSRSWAIPVGARTPWRAARCCPSGSWAWSAWPDWLRSARRGLTGSLAWRPPARRNGAPPPGDARRWRTAWHPPSSTRSSSRRQITPRSRVHGPGWVASPGKPSRAARVGWWMTTCRTSPHGALTPVRFARQSCSCTWPGSDGAQFARHVARAPYPQGGTVAAARRRARLGPRLRRDGHGLAPGACQPGLSPAPVLLGGAGRPRQACGFGGTLGPGLAVAGQQHVGRHAIQDVQRPERLGGVTVEG
jgi:hypothetical protein